MVGRIGDGSRSIYHATVNSRTNEGAASGTWLGVRGGGLEGRIGGGKEGCRARRPRTFGLVV